MKEHPPERDPPGSKNEDEIVFLEDLIPREDPVGGSGRIVFGIRMPPRPPGVDERKHGEP